MTDSPADILRRAKAKIEDPAHWCQGALRLDLSDGRRLYCARGALWAACNGSTTDAYYDTYPGPLRKAARQMGYRSPVQLNDKTDHPTVMKMFDRAIALAEQSGEGE